MRVSNKSLQSTLFFIPVLGMAYMLSQFLRSSPAVLAPELIRDLSLDPVDIGTISGTFFLVFAAIQLPVGVFLDRYGPRRVMSILVLFAALGSFLFAQADNFWGLSIGRGLMGAGCAAMLMGSFVVFSRWFPKDRFASYAAVISSIGNTGILLATLPLAATVEAVGWRQSFVGVGVYALLVSALLYGFLRDHPDRNYHANLPRESLLEGFASIRLIIRDRALWPMVPLLFVSYSSVAALTTLWAGTYLADVQMMEAIDRGEILLAMGVGAVIGPMMLGHLDRVFDTRKGVVVVGTLVRILLLFALFIWVDPHKWVAVSIFVMLAFSIGYAAILMAHARSLFHDHLIGRGMSVVNSLIMGGVAVTQFLTGLVMDVALHITGDTEQAYRFVFLFLAAVLGAALLVYLRAEDCKPSAQRDPGRGVID